MATKPDSNQSMRSLFNEIEKAKHEMELSENTFQWVQNEPGAVDLAITKKQAAVEHYNFLIRQAKKMGLKLNNKELINKLLK